MNHAIDTFTAPSRNKGYGTKAGGVTGHRENGKLLHGNGCKLGGANCFECKLRDCKWSYGK
jgi:hypothetical protein